MIKTLSPHYKTITWLSPSSMTVPDKYILELYIWDGLKASPPTVTYEIENVNPLGLTGSTDVNISRYINDILTTSLVSSTTTELLDSDSQVWVKSQVIYYIGGVAQSPEFIETDLALKGYGYGAEGVNNSTPTNGILAFGSEVKVNTDSFYSLPVFMSETLVTDILVKSYPGNVIDKTYTEAATTDSTDSVKQVWVNVAEAINESYIEITYNGAVVYTLLIEDELRYNPIDIFYTNKEGQLTPITFFKERVNEMETSSENYESSTGQPKDGVHQFVTFDKNGRSGFEVNSGFVQEDNNDIFKQLFLSNDVWEFNGTDYIPLTLDSKSIEYKTRQRDRLLNYTVKFNYAFNEVNSI